MRHSDGGALPPRATKSIAIVATATAALLIGLSGRYGYHRDELYFIASGHHLAWGYPDQPAFVPFLARVMTAISSTSLVVLRLPSAIATAATVVLTGLTARELGADKRAQTLAALAMAVANLTIGTGHLLSTTTFYLPFSAAIVLVSLRAVRTGRDRLWLVVGLIAGIGLFDTDLIAFLLGGLVIGVAICGPRQIFRSGWLYAGGAVAFLLWLPYLLWQAHHGWPELTVAHSIATGGSGTSAPRGAFIPEQILLSGFFFAPMWVAGLVSLNRNPRLRWCRAIAVAYAVMAVAFIVTGGKPYYLGGIFPVLFAAGAQPFLEWCDRRGWRRLPVTAAVLSLPGMLITLPIVPLAHLHKTGIVALNYDAGETVAWPAYVGQIAAVYDTVPRLKRPSTIVLGSNYGETGAVDRYGAKYDLPTAYGVQNATWLWGPPPPSANFAIAIGFDRSEIERVFTSVRLGGKLNNHLDISDDEQDAPIWICSGRRASWSVLWPKLRDYG